MKTIRYIFKKQIILLMMLSVFCLKGQAQVEDKLHFNVDWQMNAPISTDFADKISGWGMNFEAGYYVTPRWSLGAFLSFHTNHKYVDRQTLQLSPTESLTTDQQFSAFQLPFGLSTSYRLGQNDYLKPYVGVRLGAMYAENSSYMTTVRYYSNPWGFYVSPELGMNIYSVPDKRLGFHVALYYSYATNQTDLLTYSMNGQNNLGFRVGICF